MVVPEEWIPKSLIRVLNIPSGISEETLRNFLEKEGAITVYNAAFEDKDFEGKSRTALVRISQDRNASILSATDSTIHFTY